MKGFVLNLSVLSGLCAGSLLAQSIPPQPVWPVPNTTVPARIAVAEYGEPSASPCGLRIRCSMRETISTMIRMEGGIPDALAIMIAGTQAADIHIPGLGNLLVAPPVVHVQGLVDEEGGFAVPIELAQPALAGLNLHLQCWQTLDGMHFDHTAGLRVEYHSSNPQPSLGYRGPPVQPVLCRFVGTTQNDYELMARFTVPSSGYEVDVRSVERDGDVTRVHVGFTYPKGPGLPIMADLRVVAGVGTEPGNKIELWIEETFESCVCVTLAAVVDTDY